MLIASTNEVHAATRAIICQSRPVLIDLGEAFDAQLAAANQARRGGTLTTGVRWTAPVHELFSETGQGSGGARVFMPPESLPSEKEPNYEKCDVYALGVNLFMMMNGWSRLNSSNDAYPPADIPLSDSYSQPLRDLVRSLLNKNVMERPSIHDAHRRIVELVDNWASCIVCGHIH
jgi:serine/threonine protein kinase